LDPNKISNRVEHASHVTTDSRNKHQHPNRRLHLSMLWLLVTLSVFEAAAFTSTTTATCYAPSSRARRPQHGTPTTLSYSSMTSPGTTSMDISEYAERDIPSLEQWASEVVGIQKCDGFQLTTGEAAYQQDVYAMTSEDIPTGTPVLFVPEALIFSADKAMEELRVPEMEQAEKILFSVNAGADIKQYYLMIKLLMEIEKGEESDW
jgi:hypothetical protein